jgi:pyrroloquinoline quinone biosynthesis protein B
MQVRILGAAAGGGFPQWNCHCSGCEMSRAGQAIALTQSSLAIQSQTGEWFLINASPDVRQQIEAMRSTGCFVETDRRSSPFAGVVLTDAEIDHSTGLILLRESAQPLRVYSSIAVKTALTSGYPLFTTLQNYCGVNWQALPLASYLKLAPDLEIEAFALSTKPPKYMSAESVPETVWGVGLTIHDRTTGGILTYAPGLADIDSNLYQRFERSDCILIDGTFWTDDELPAQGFSQRSALQMGHLPLSGKSGSLQQLSQLTKPRQILVHINNTNPILLPDSWQRQAVKQQGVEVGYDGLMFQL